MAEAESLPTLLGSRVCVDVASEVVPLKGRQAPAALELADDLPEDFAPEVCVKNTFIQEVPQLSPSLGAFYRERMVSTCPSKHIGRLSPPLLESATASQQHAVVLAPAEEADELEARTPLGSPCGIQTPCSLQSPVGFPAAVGSSHFPPIRMTSGSCVQTTSSSSGMPLATVPPRSIHCGMDKVVRPVLSLADSIAAELSRLPASRTAESAPCSMAVSILRGKTPTPPPPPSHSPRVLWRKGCRPTGTIAGRCEATPLNAVPLPPPPPSYSPKVLLSLGSKDHSAGTCKPCAFLYTKGCDNGISCQFCHACAPEEIKRRRKQRLEQRRTARRSLDDQALCEEESA